MGGSSTFQESLTVDHCETRTVLFSDDDASLALTVSAGARDRGVVFRLKLERLAICLFLVRGKGKRRRTSGSLPAPVGARRAVCWLSYSAVDADAIVGSVVTEDRDSK